MQNYIRGDSLIITWQPLGLAQVIIGMHDANGELSALLFDVTTTLSGGLTARLGGKLDHATEFNGFYDLDQVPYLAPVFLLPGQRGFYTTQFALGHIVQVPSIIEKIRYQGAVDSEVKYSFSAKMDSRAGVLVTN